VLPAAGAGAMMPDALPDSLLGTMVARLPVWESRLYLGAFALVLLWELILPMRPTPQGAWRRWGVNIGLWAVNVLLARLLPLASALAVALWAEARGLGLFHLMTVPPPLAVLGGLLALDAAAYGVHRLMHRVPLLWRLHRTHHSDTDIDVTTGLRNHPLEVLLVPVLILPVVPVLGVPPLALALSALVMALMDSFTHANARLGHGLERALRRLIVTPDMHRIHHSARPTETDSNYGMFLSVWDRLFGSYVAAPANGPLGMTIGLEDFRSRRDGRFDQVLLNPLRSPARNV